MLRAFQPCEGRASRGAHGASSWADSGVGSLDLCIIQEPSLFSGRRGAALLAVIVLHSASCGHFIRGWPASSSRRSFRRWRLHRSTSQGHRQTTRPRHQARRNQPYVPPPEFVDVQAPLVETTAITQRLRSTDRRRRSQWRRAQRAHRSRGIRSIR